MPPRTIDNLGSDVSERYARDQALTQPSYIKGAAAIPSRTEIDVSIPFFPGEVEALLQDAPTHICWALFVPPQAYYEQRKRLFSFQLTPTIGPEGKWEAHAQKALEKLQSLSDEEKEHSPEPESLRAKEKKILTLLLATIDNLNKLLIDINCKKSQYQKG